MHSEIHPAQELEDDVPTHSLFFLYLVLPGITWPRIASHAVASIVAHCWW